VKRSRMISLIWTLINAHYGLSKKKIQYIVNKKGLWEPFLLIAVFAFLFIFVGPLFVNLQGLMIDQYKQLGLEGLFLNNAILVTGMFGFFLGIFLVINEFFYTKNLNLLLSLPIKPKEILAAKMILILIDLFWISLLFLLPSLVIFGIKTSADLLYWVTIFFILAFSQTFPLLLQIIVLLPISRYIHFGKHKDFFVYFMSILLVVVVIGFQFYVTNDLAGSEFSQEKMIQMLSNPQGMISQMGKGYPPAFLGVKALLSSGFQQFYWLCSFVFMHLVGIYIALLIGEKTYYRTYLKLQDHYHDKDDSAKALSIEKTMVSEGSYRSLMRREWRYFLRVPSFAFNGFGNVIVFPLLIVVFFFAKNNPEFQQFISFFQTAKDYVLPVGILLGSTVGSMNMLASTIFSREGKMLDEIKVLPVRSDMIFKVKLSHVMLMSTIGPLSVSLIFLLLFNSGLPSVLLIFLISELLVLFLNLLQIALDATFPNLTWDNPQKAMKQNINGLYTIILVFGFTGLTGYLGYLLREKLSGLQMTMILLIIGLIGVILSYRLAKKAVQKFLMKDYCRN